MVARPGEEETFTICQIGTHQTSVRKRTNLSKIKRERTFRQSFPFRKKTR